MRSKTKQIFAPLLVTTLLVTGFHYTPTPVQASTTGQNVSVEVIYSSYNDTDTNNRLTQQMDKTFTPVSNNTADGTITIDPSITYQSWLGFGGSLENTSVYEFTRLSEADRAAALNALFNPASGNNYNLVRIPIGHCDFYPEYVADEFPDHGSWTYDDMPPGETDPDLTNFSIQRDIDSGKIALLQQVLQINPDVKYMACLWSPPAWMKTSGTIFWGGTVYPQYYQAMANYYVKFIQAYKALGIPIYAISVTNEPSIEYMFPTTGFSTSQYEAFAEILVQTFENNDIDTKIWGVDDNDNVSVDYATVLKNNANVSSAVDSFAFHNYSQYELTESTALHYQYPDTTSGIDEMTHGASKIIEYMRNYMSYYMYWVTFREFMNPGPGPGVWQDQDRNAEEDPDYFTEAQVSWAGTPGASTYQLNNWYYHFGQFSRYIQAGAVRIDSNEVSAENVSNVAFKNPDGTIVIVVSNRIAEIMNSVDMNTPAKTIKIVTPEGEITDTIPGDTVATYVYTPTTGEALDKDNWTATASNTHAAFTAAQAIDGNTDTFWTSGIDEANGQTFTLNLGSVQTFDQVTLNSGRLADDCPVVYELYTSADGTNWGNAIATGSGSPNMTNITFASQTKQYIQIKITGAAPHWWTIADISVYNTKGGLLPNTNWTAVASHTDAYSVASNAIDGKATTRWANGTSQENGQWFTVDLGELKTFNKIEIDAGRNDNDYPRGYELYVSGNGTNWGNPIASGVGIAEKVQVSFQSVTARYIKIVQTDTAPSNYWSISEFRVFNQNPIILPRVGWSATASGTASGSSEANVFDGSNATRWSAGTIQTGGEWFRADMGKINILTGVGLNAGNYLDNYPNVYRVELSLDGVTWNTVAQGSIPNADNNISFTASAARYVKITQIGSAASSWSIAELNLYGVESAPDLGIRLSHQGWIATASSTEIGGDPNVAIDGQLMQPRENPRSFGGGDSINNTASRWSSGIAQTGSEWFQVDLGSPQTFNTVTLNCGIHDYKEDYGRQLSVSVSQDGTNWMEVATAYGYDVVTRIQFSDVSARYLRINQTGQAPNWWSIAELNLYLK